MPIRGLSSLLGGDLLDSQTPLGLCPHLSQRHAFCPVISPPSGVLHLRTGRDALFVQENLKLLTQCSSG
jgi:hypothetical protein